MVKRLRTRLRAGAADQRAFSLIETMFTVVLLSVVLGAILSLSNAAQRVVPREEALAYSLRDAQVSLDKMTRQLRQAQAVTSATATSMDVNVPVRGVPGTVRRILFDCNEPHPTVAGLKQCISRTYVGATIGPKVTVIPRVTSASFTYSPAGATPPANPPKFAQLTLRVPASGERTKDGYTHAVFLDDGFYMRNLDNG
jgi:prepilin-type N-terminal cleavage/methylation domain-containing protein